MSDQHSVANAAMEALRDTDKDKFRSVFWSPLTFMLTETRIQQIFDLIEFLLGPLESFTVPTLHEEGRIKKYKVLCKFQRSHQAMTLSFWGNKIVSVGLGTAMDLGLVPGWKVPSYVDDNSFEEQEISLRPSWLQPAILGSLTLPKAPGRKPAVLLVPGSGPIDRDETFGGGKTFKDLAHGLSSSGIVTLRMDKPTAIVMFKQVVTKSLTLQDEYITPGLTALQYLSNHPSVDPSRIFILGHSLGGCVAPRLCKASSVPIAGLISCAGSDGNLACTIARQMRQLNEWFPRVDPAQHNRELAQYNAVVRAVEAGGIQPGEADPTKELSVPIPLMYLLDCRRHDPIAIAKMLDVPMLFVQGKKDWQITMDDEYIAWQTGMEDAVAIDKIEWKVYERVGHMLTVVEEGKKGNFMYDAPQNVEEEIVRDVAGFVKRICASGHQ